MQSEDQEFWEWAAPKLRREYRHTDMTPEETEAFLDAVADEALPPHHIDHLLASLRANALPHWQPEPNFMGSAKLRYADVAEDVYQLNRHKGQEDAATLHRIEELRHKALNDAEDPDTLADGTAPAGEGR